MLLVLSTALVAAPMAETSQRLLQMLDYVGVDYPPTTNHGKIIDAVEYQEMQEFSGIINELISTLPENPSKSGLIAQFLPRAQLLLVTTPQPTAQRVARRSALMAAEVNQEVIAVIENMSYFEGDDGKKYEIFGSGGGAALAEDLGVPLIGQIPLLSAMREGADNAEPVSVAAPDSEAALVFMAAAEALIKLKPRVRTHPELVIR